MNRRRFHLTCVVECDPICAPIIWTRNGQDIVVVEDDDGDDSSVGRGGLFRVSTYAKPPDPLANLLLRVASTLEMDFDRLMNGGLSADRPSEEYSCRSGANRLGPPVESKTTFRVHYPPRTVSVGQK